MENIFPLRMMVVGHGRHGKDTAAEILRDTFGATFVSSSWFMAEKVIYPFFERTQPGRYASAQACYDDRANERATWFNLIAESNAADLTTLGRAIFDEYDLYVGNRNAREFHALRNAGVFDVSIWIDATERLEYREPRTSLTIEPWMCDFVVDNNGSQADLGRNIASLMGALGVQTLESMGVSSDWSHATAYP
ncbi:MAG: hypothetical protein U5N53_09005 [Mycobacterium sp.]|nr:hypothetical protein [Mycobacterium sp.]